VSVNDDPSTFAEWNLELLNTRFTTVEGVAEWLLMAIAGLDNTNPQEQKTPTRFVKALRELTTPDRDWEFTTFDTLSDEMVVVRDIRFASLCRHHILPFMGVCHIAYIPNISLAGLSKLPRLVQQCSASLNTQEELTSEIATILEGKLDPIGVGVMMEAEHTCMTIRGALAPGTLTYTASMKGVFSDHTKTAKSEFLSRISSGRS
jgi:GTP cyclohydrolase I